MTIKGGWVFLAVALAICASGFAADLSIKPGDQVATVDVQNKQQLKALLDMDLDIWSHEFGIGPIDVHVSVAERQRLDAAGLFYKVRNADLFATRQREIAETQVRAAGDFTAYKNLADIVAFINGLAAARPDLCQVSTFGTSVEGRSMYVLSVTGPTPGPKPAVFYHGLIHAREWIAGPVVLYLADYLVSHYDSDPCVKALMDRMTFYLAPCVNPDGYNYTWTTTRLWRKNRRNNGGGVYGVDLNRNFTYKWAYDNSGSSSSSSSETYRGPSAGSEPETQAIMNFITSHAEVKAYMDYHSYSQLLMWPWGYTSALTPDNARFSAVGTVMRQRIVGVNGVDYVAGPVNATIYPANGVSIDFAYGSAGRFAYTTELRDTGDYGFTLPADQILPTCQENLQGILYLSQWASSGILLDTPNGVPARLAAGQPTTITISIADAQETYAAGSARLHYRLNPADPYTEVVFNSIGGGLYTATIPAATCGQTAQFYMTASGSGGYTAKLPCNAPTDIFEVSVVNVVPAVVAYSFPMTSNPGWTTTGQWAFGTPTGSCGDPTTGYTGSNVYGYNLAGCYPNNLPSVQYLTTTPIDCSALSQTQLRFRRWLGVESSAYDHANVQVSNDGTNWTTVWNFSGSTLTETSWSLPAYNISAVADGQPTVYVRWGMGTSDSSVNYSGWNIDDVEIIGEPALLCAGALLGDVNDDGKVDGLDVDSFVRVLMNPGAATGAETCAADINQTCGVTQEDLDPFIALLLGT